MVEKIAERFFYTVKYFNFSKLLLSDDKKAFLKTPKTVQICLLPFPGKLNCLKLNHF